MWLSPLRFWNLPACWSNTARKQKYTWILANDVNRINLPKVKSETQRIKLTQSRIKHSVVQYL